jgi:hypothetical protein
LRGGSTCSPGAGEENPADERDEPHADQPVDHDSDRRGQGGDPDAASSSFVSRFPLRLLGPARPSTPFGGWASAIVLWGFAAYRFNAGPYAVSVTIICWAAPPALLNPLLGVYINRIGPKAATFPV